MFVMTEIALPFLIAIPMLLVAITWTEEDNQSVVRTRWLRSWFN